MVRSSDLNRTVPRNRPASIEFQFEICAIKTLFSSTILYLFSWLIFLLAFFGNRHYSQWFRNAGNKMRSEWWWCTRACVWPGFRLWPNIYYTTTREPIWTLKQQYNARRPDAHPCGFWIVLGSFFGTFAWGLSGFECFPFHFPFIDSLLFHS